jgi:hypothetical protein
MQPFTVSTASSRHVVIYEQCPCVWFSQPLRGMPLRGIGSRMHSCADRVPYISHCTLCGLHLTSYIWSIHPAHVHINVVFHMWLYICIHAMSSLKACVDVIPDMICMCFTSKAFVLQAVYKGYICLE